MTPNSGETVTEHGEEGCVVLIIHSFIGYTHMGMSIVAKRVKLPGMFVSLMGVPVTSWLLCSPAGFLLVHCGRQHVMSPVLTFLSPV